MIPLFISAQQKTTIHDTVYLDKDQIIEDYRKELTEDSKNHGEHIIKYYDRLWQTGGIILTFIVGLLTFAGIKTLQNAKNEAVKWYGDHLSDEISKKFDEEFKEHWKKKFEEMSQKFLSDQARRRELHEDMGSNYQDLINADKDTFVIPKRVTELTYDVPDGRKVNIKQQRWIKNLLEAEKRDLKTFVNVIKPGGEVRILYFNPKMEYLHYHPHGKKVKFTFDEPLKQNETAMVELEWEVTDGFDASKDSWYLFHVNPVEDDIFKVNFKSSNVCKKIDCYGVTSNDLSEKVDIVPLKDETIPGIVQFHIALPPNTKNYTKYKIEWEF